MRGHEALTKPQRLKCEITTTSNDVNYFEIRRVKGKATDPYGSRDSSHHIAGGRTRPPTSGVSYELVPGMANRRQAAAVLFAILACLTSLPLFASAASVTGAPECPCLPENSPKIAAASEILSRLGYTAGLTPLDHCSRFDSANDDMSGLGQRPCGTASRSSFLKGGYSRGYGHKKSRN